MAVAARLPKVPVLVDDVSLYLIGIDRTDDDEGDAADSY